jgi:HD-GYP domain-containing protein (c-di-GMP phosphodiesterase class II)
MKKLQLSSLVSGMKFTQDVFIDGKNLLVPAGIPIKQKDLDQLAKWGVTEVTTEGEAVKAEAPPAAAPAPEQEGSVLILPAVQENKELYRLYTDMIDKLNVFFQQIANEEEVQLKPIEAIVNAILTAIRASSNDMIGFVLGGEVSGYGMPKSSINTAILSAIIGINMKMPNHKLYNLVLGALLHDAGMLMVPEGIVKKTGNLSEEEAQKIKAHPVYSYRIISRDLKLPDEVGTIALQHHERWDGEGYPRRLAGSQIELLSRIVSVADAFEAMVSEKPYRNSMIGYTAMKFLLSDNSRRFDPEVLHVFIKSMGIYPIGSVVLLNNAAIARVTDVHPDAPLRPRVRILIDEFGKEFRQDEGEETDLLAEKTLFIARAIDPKQYKEK